MGDLSRLRAKAKAMHAAFPAECNVMHAYAIKANPVARIITELASLGGGAECASIVEVEQALKVGIEPKKIIFDSPCKTLKEQMAVAQQANEQQKAYSAQLQAKICQLQAQSPSAEWTDWDSPYGTDSGK